MNNDDMKKIFDKLTPKDHKKEEIYNKIMETKDNKSSEKVFTKKTKNKRNKLRTALILSLILIFSITVYAVSNIPQAPQSFSSKIKNFSLSEDASDINIYDSDKGYKLTAESVFGDSKFVYVLISVERENDEKLRSIWNTGREFWVNVSDKSISKDKRQHLIGSSRYHSLDEGFNTKDKEYFLQVHNVEMEENGVSLIGGNLHLEIDRISLGLFGFGTKGDWELDIPLKYKDISQIYEINKEFEYKDKKIVLDKIHFSELNAAIYLTSKDKALQEFSEEVFNIKFKLKDGTIVTAQWDTGTGDLEGSQYYYSISLVENGKINPQDIVSILLEDIEIPLDLK
ncbi:MAG: DUF4179 domain-containing protein [Tissierella sp.]|uniref:DUF4179 domain-containing protein n=1 Tax=Tissierella sp. TaxID=41274 RepID=UPI003F992F45